MEKNSSKDRGTVLWRFSQKFQFAADKIIPVETSILFDSYIHCLCCSTHFYRQRTRSTLS